MAAACWHDNINKKKAISTGKIAVCLPSAYGFAVFLSISKTEEWLKTVGPSMNMSPMVLVVLPEPLCMLGKATERA